MWYFLLLDRYRFFNGYCKCKPLCKRYPSQSVRMGKFEVRLENVLSRLFFFSDGLVYPVMDRWSYKQHTLWEISRRTLSLKDSFTWKVCKWHLTSVFNHSQNDMYTIHPHIHKPSKIHLRLLYRAVNYNNDLWKETQHNNKPWILMYTWKKY